MPRFYVTCEGNEDTFGPTDSLPDAIRLAKDVAKSGKPGELVLIESAEGRGIMQFVLKPDGTIAENSVLPRDGYLPQTG